MAEEKQELCWANVPPAVLGWLFLDRAHDSLAFRARLGRHHSFRALRQEDKGYGSPCLATMCSQNASASQDLRGNRRVDSRDRSATGVRRSLPALEPART